MRNRNALYEFLASFWAPLWVGFIGAIILLSADRWPGWWAFQFLGHVPPPLRALLAALVLAVGLRPVQITLTHLRLARVLDRLGWWLVPVAGVGFWLLREQTFRGDALLKLQLLDTQTLQADPYIWKEPLDSFLTYTFTGWLRPLAIGADFVVAGLSVAAGVGYVAVVLMLAQDLGLRGGQRWLAVLGLMALGSSQLWFGHVENYSLVTACSTFTIVLAIGYLVGRKPLWSVGLAAGAAVSLHLQAVFILPPLLLLLDRRRWAQQLRVLATTVPLIPILTVALLLASGVPRPGVPGEVFKDPQLFWAPVQMFAPQHLLDALNNLWLLVPALPFLVTVGLTTARQRFSWQNRGFLYLSALVFSLLVYHFAFQNDWPRPRDWDLFAIVGPGVALWGMYPCLIVLPPSGSAAGAVCKALLLPTLAFATVIAGCWVGVNYSYLLVHPDPTARALYERYRLMDLVELLPTARVTPTDPICTDPATDPTGCQRVTLTQFTLSRASAPETHAVIFAHAPAEIVLPLVVPDQPSFLWVSPVLDPLAWDWGGDGVTFQVRVRAAGREDLLWTRHLSPNVPGDRDWQQMFVSLDAYQGQEIELLLITDPGPTGDATADRAGWGVPWLMRGTLVDADGRS